MDVQPVIIVIDDTERAKLDEIVRKYEATGSIDEEIYVEFSLPGIIEACIPRIEAIYTDHREIIAHADAN